MDWPWIVWEIAVNGIENALFVLLLTRQLDYPKNKRKYVILGYLILVVNVTTLNFTGVPSLTTVLIVLAVQLIFALSAFQGSIPKRLLWGCSGMIVAQISNVLTYNLFSIFGHVNLLDSLAPTQTRLEMMIVYILLYALFYFVLSHIRPRRKIFLNWQFRIVMIAIIFVGIYAIQKIIDIYYLLSGSESSYELALVNDNLIFISAIIVATFLGILFIFEYIGYLAQKNIDAQAELQQTKFENAHLEHVKDTYQALRAWKHDFQNHMDLLHTYLKDKDYKQMDKYLSQMTAEIEPSMHMYYTGNNVADAVLSNKLFIARSKGIDITAGVVIPEKLTISDVQLCSVLSNLLDNAIEAQESVLNPFINVSIRPERGMLFIKIENSAPGVYQYVKNQLISSKQEKDHGIGLQQVRKIIENARGIIDIEPLSDRFTVKILMPLEAESEAV